VKGETHLRWSYGEQSGLEDVDGFFDEEGFYFVVGGDRPYVCKSI